MRRLIRIKVRADDLATFTGRSCRESIEIIGRISLFFYTATQKKAKSSHLFEQMYLLGDKSLLFVASASIFVGFITILTYTNLTDSLHIDPFIMGRMVSRVVFMELGPALVGLILAGKIGATIASEISSMRISEQIDALTCLSISPMSYLACTRIWACFLMGPVYFVVSSTTSIISSQIFAYWSCGVRSVTFYSGMKDSFDIAIVMMGLIKVTLFSTTNAVIGCFYGFEASGGASGVGIATRNTVVASSLLILFENLILTKILI